MVRKALDCLMERVKSERLRQSAELYAEIYEQDEELQELTRASMEEWLNDSTNSRNDHPGHSGSD